MVNANMTHNTTVAHGTRMVTKELAVRNAQWNVDRLGFTIQDTITTMTPTEIVSIKFRYERANTRLAAAIAAYNAAYKEGHTL